MYQIDNSSVAGTQPASSPAGTAGFFTDGNPATGVAATVVPAEFLNSVMLELLGVLQSAGIQPDKTKSNQIAAAINSIVQGGAKTYTLDTGTANTFIAGYSPAITTLTDGLILHFLAKTACTGASTLKVDGMGIKPLLNKRHAATKPGQISIGSLCTVQYVSTLDSFVLTDVTGAAVPSTIAGYGITDAYTSAQIDALLGAQTRVVSTPTVSGSSSVTTGTVVALTATASSLLTGGSITNFTWTLPDGTTNTTAATSGSATKSVTAIGSIGASYAVKVMATDNAGNTSLVATKSIAITNHAAPTAPTTVATASSVYQNSTGNTLSVSGATASDGATITYTITQSGQAPLTLSKSSGIVAGEVITYSAPAVAADTPITLSITAVDSMGGVSPAKTASVNISAVPSAPGTPFGGGYYVGRLKVGGVSYALIVSPRAQGEGGPFTVQDDGNPPWPGLSTWDGLANTNAMTTGTTGGGHPAANFCKNLTIGGFTDWALPAKDQLEVLYRNLKPTADYNWVPGYTINSLFNNNGVNPSSDPVGVAYTDVSPARTALTAFQSTGAEGFTQQYYHSSSYGDASNNPGVSWRQRFTDGGAFTGVLADQYWVRAVRMIRI